MQPPPAGSALLAGPDEGLLAPLAGPRSGASPLHPGGVASHALFRQAGQAYLLPAARVLGVVGAEHLRPLPGPVAG
jgi:hypothetical protein